MWVGRKTEQVFEDMCSLACSEHKQQVVLLQDYNNLVKIKKKLFWTTKIQIMDPIYFTSDYNHLQKSWILSGDFVPKNCSFPINHELSISTVLKEKIVLFDSVSTFTLAMLSKACCICCNLETEREILQYYPTKYSIIYADHLKTLKELNLQDALKFINNLPLFKDIRDEFDDYDQATVCLSFLISYYYFMDISENPFVALRFFEKTFEEVEEMKNDFIKDLGNEEYKKQNYKLAVSAYSSGLCKSCYSYYLLGNRAQTFLKLDNYHRAELDCRAAIILRPEWSKGYYRLAQSLVGQKKIHEAHVAADFGLKNSNVVPLLEYQTLKEYNISLRDDCEICQNSKSSDNKDISKIKLPPDFDNCSDVPELIESSSSDCSQNESDVDNEEEVQLASDDEGLAQCKVEGTGCMTNTDVPDLVDSSCTSESDPESSVEEKCPVHKQGTSELSAVNVNENHKDEKKEEKFSEEMENILCNKDGGNDKVVFSECKEDEQKQATTEIKSKKLEAKPKRSPDADPAELESDRLKNFSESLTDGSSALINNCIHVAKYHFNETLSQIKTNPELFQLGKDDLLALKYSYATACCKSGCLEDLLKAISGFKEIISEDSNIEFPAAYYGLALSYYKMNNFKEALNCLKILASSMENGMNFKTFNWPGTESLIEETSCAKLKVLVEDLTKKCECPPPSDALCRYEQCSFQPVIYFSDPDFKGFVSLHCNERCLLQYHVACWKCVKDAFDRSDKEFLDSHCITPDCGGLIVKVEIYGKNGSIEKSFESEEGKPRKSIKHKKTKLEKRFEIREMRKSKRQRTTSLSESQKAAQVTPEPVVEPVVPAEKPKTEVEEKVSEKERLNFAECPQPIAPVIQSDLSATAKPFYVIKKEVENKEPELKPKHKEKKRQKKAALSIDEFCGNYSGSEDLSYYSEYRLRLHRLQETRRVIEENDDTWPTFCESERIPELDPNRPFHIPEGLRNDPNTLETVLQSYAPVTSEHSKALKDYIYPRFENILQDRRTLHLSDPVVDKELNSLPQEWREIIEESGGFKSFMLQSMKFAVVGETLCFFSEMLNLYNPSKLEEFTEIYESLPLGTDSSSSLFRIEGTISDLNPNAAEYSPSDSKSDNSQEPGSCVSVCSADSMVVNAQCQAGNNGEYKHSIPSCSSSDIYSNSMNCLADIYASEQTTNGKQSETESKNDEKSLLTLLTNLRRPLSRYSLTSETSKEGGNAFVENSESSLADSKTDCLSNSKSKQLIEKVLILKSHLISDPFACKILESMCNICTSEINDSVEDHVSSAFQVEQVDKCEQAGTPEIILISEGVMKEDEEMKETQEKLTALTLEFEKLSDKKKALEEQLVQSLDTISQLQNKFNVELTSLEKRLTETETLKKEENKAQKAKISSLEKEIKQWRQKHDLVVETEKDTRKENTKLQVKMNNYISKLEEMNRKCDDYEEKLASKSIIVEKCEKVVQENGQLMDKWKKDIVEATKSARKAEVELLRLKRTTFLQKLDMIIMFVNNKIQELQTHISETQFSLQPYIAASLKTCTADFKVHSQEILKVRINTQKKADELISKVEEGVPLAELEDFVFPSLPQFPNMSDYIVPQTAGSIPSQTSSNSQLNVGLSSQQGLLPTPPQTHSGSNYLSFQQSLGLNQLARNATETTPARRAQDLMSQLQYQNSLGFNMPMTSLGLNPQINQFSNYAPLFSSPVSNAYSQFPMNIPPKQPNPLIGCSIYANSVSSNKNNVLNHVVPPGIMPTTQKESDVTPTTTTAAEDLQFNKESSETEIRSKTTSVEQESTELTSGALQTHHRVSLSSSLCSENVENNKDIDESGSVNSFHSLPSQSCKNFPNPALSDTSETRSQKSGIHASACEVSNESAALELGYSTGTESEPPLRGAESARVSNSQAQSLQEKACAKTEKKSSYTKILAKLSVRYQDIPEADLLGYIRQYREEKKKLTGMTIDAIVSGVSHLVENQKKREIMLRQPAVPIFRAKTVVNKPLVSVPPKPPLPPPQKPSTDNPWVKPGVSEKSVSPWTGEDDDDDRICAICLEDMNAGVMKVECGHKFHQHCIKHWLNKNSNCPKCRVHLLLPEDYPKLK